MKKRFTILGAILMVVGLGFFGGAVYSYGTIQDGYDSLQSFSEAQNVTLSYNEDGQLIDRGTTEGADEILVLLGETWGWPIDEGSPSA